MATIEEIKEIIKEEVKERVDIDALDADASLDGAGIDSLDMSSVFMNIEDKYGIKIPDADIEKLKTVNDIVSYVNDKS
jgi:acyl carrier protein